MVWLRTSENYGLVQGTGQLSKLYQFVDRHDKTKTSGWFGTADRKVYERLPESDFEETAKELIQKPKNGKTQSYS